MQKFKQIREAAKYNPYAIGMAAAKKKAGITAKHAENVPKAVIVKGHEIAKKIKANEEFDAELDALAEELEFLSLIEQFTAEELAEFMASEDFEQLDEVSKATLSSYVKKSHDQLMKHTGSVNMKYGRGDKDATAYALDPVALRKTANRTKGMNQAIDKLAGAK